jgi:phage/plasmid-associated DNA primase
MGNRGAVEYHRIGLAPPAAVTQATEAYLIEEDSFGRWVEECCTVSRQLFGKGAALWGSWKEWAERNREPAGGRKSFTQTMEQHGYRPDKFQGTRGFYGIALRPKKRPRAEP